MDSKLSTTEARKKLLVFIRKKACNALNYFKLPVVETLDTCDLKLKNLYSANLGPRWISNFEQKRKKEENEKKDPPPLGIKLGRI